LGEDAFLDDFLEEFDKLAEVEEYDVM